MIPNGIEIVIGEDCAMAILGTRVVGELHWAETGEIAYVRTLAKLRRQGIATALWRAVEATGIRLEHSAAISADGRAWAASFQPVLAGASA